MEKWKSEHERKETKTQRNIRINKNGMKEKKERKTSRRTEKKRSKENRNDERGIGEENEEVKRRKKIEKDKL